MKYRILFAVLTGCFFLLHTAQAQVFPVTGYLEGGRVTQKGVPEIDTLIRLAYSYKPQQPDTAIGLFAAALQDSRLLNYNGGIAASLLGMGSVYGYQKRNPEKGLALIREAYPFCLHANEQLLLQWYNYMGCTFYDLNKFDSAAGYFYTGLAMARHLGWKDKNDLFLLHYRMGVTFYNMGQNGKALDFLRQARDIAAKDHFPENLIQSYLSLAGVFIKMGQPDSALHYLGQIEKLSSRRPAALEQQINNLYGIMYFKQQRPEKAITVFKKAIACTDGGGAHYISGIAGLGAAYGLLKQYREAAYYTEAALSVANREGLRGAELLDIYNNLSEIYDSLRDYKKAYQYHFIGAQLKDSLDNINSTRWMEELKGRYQLAEKNNELKEKQLQLVLNRKALRQKDLWITGIVSFALVLLVILYLKHRLQQQKAKASRQKQRIEQLKAVIDGEEREKSRIGRQLHDDIMVELSIVKMGLDALSYKHPRIQDTDDYKGVLLQIDNTGLKIRQTAHNLMPDILLHDGLVSAIQYFCNYVTAMAKLHINFQYYGDITELPPEIEISIYRIIQELVQNVMKHAKARNVLIQTNYREGLLSLTVEDDGTGINAESETAGDKMGLRSIRMRVKALQGSIDIHQRIPNGTSINIELKV